jgi:PAS domain S-box-containing protein
LLFTIAIQRRQAEEALKASNEDYQQVVSNITTVVWKADIANDGTFKNTYISPVLDELLDLPAGTMKNDWDKYFKYIKPKYLERVNNAFREAIQSPGKLIDCEYKVLKDNGQTAWFHSKGRCFEKNGKLHVFGSTTDITERKQAEQELNAKSQFLERLIQQSPLPTFVLDAKGICIMLNEAFLNFYSIPDKDLILGKNSLKEPANIKHDVVKYIKKALEGEIVEVPEIEFISPFATKPVYVSIKLFPIHDTFGHLTNVVVMQEDITERMQAERELQKHREHLEELVKKRTKELEEKNKTLKKSQQAMTYLVEDVNEARAELDTTNSKLKDANKELEAFSYSVSHDLRAPLRSIDGFSKILLEDYQDTLDKQGKHYFQRIRAGTQKMGQLIDDLLHLSRIGRQPLNKKSINLKTIANEVYQLLEPERKNRKVKFTVHKCPKTLADPNLMLNVFLNLLSNALKFTKNKPLTEIEFGCKEKDNKTIFFIKDNGVGFDMKLAGKLFSPFQRLHSNEEYEGSGIGLAIVQRIIFRHGGRIWIESEPNKGTTFYFTL